MSPNSFRRNQREPIRTYLAGFPGFIYDPDEPPPRQFDRLAEERGWSLEFPARKMALRELQTALFRQFNPSYEDYSAVVEVDWLKVAEGSAAATAILTPSDTTESDRTPGKIDFDVEPVSEPKPTMEHRRSLEHMDAFFSEYPQFERDPTKSLAMQLNKLRRQEKWWGHRHDLWDLALNCAGAAI